MKKFSNMARIVLLLFSCGLPSLYGLRQIIDNDIWLHLKTGAWLWSHRAIPHTQLYSFLLGQKEWIDHEWLFQAIIYPVFYTAGPNGLIIFRFLLVALILSLFFKVAKNTSYYFIFSALTIALSVTVASSRFLIRPEIFSLLFLTSFIFLLKSYQGKNSIFLVLPLQILWVNIHGYYIIGPLLVGLFILARIMEAKLKLPFSWNENKLDNKYLQKIIYLFFLLIMAAFINPYFLKGALYPFKVLGSIVSGPLEGSYPFSFVSELEAVPILHIIYADRVFLLSAVIIIFFFSLLVNIKRTDLFDLMVFFIFFAFTIKAKRHIGMFALSSGLLALFNFSCAEYDATFFKKKGRQLFKIIFQRVIPILVLVILIVNLFDIIKVSYAMISGKYIYNLKGEAKDFLFGRAELNHPVGAADFIKENHIKGNIFNFFNSGAYLIYSLYPDCRVFIDGRTELYGDTLLKAADAILAKPQLLDKIKDDFSIECVVWPCHYNPKVAVMFKYLHKSKDWKLVFFDGLNSVFVRDLPKYRSLIRSKQIELKDFRIEPDKELLNLAREKKYYSFLFFDTAKFFYNIDMPEKASEAIKVAEEVNPEDYQTYNLKAVLLAEAGKDKEALDEFFKAAKIRPADPVTFKNIGVFYLQRGHPEIAREYFERGLKLNPRDKELHNCLKEIEKYIKR